MASSVEKPLSEQGVLSAEQVATAFAEVRARAEADLRGVSNEKLFEEFRNQWLGRKSGVVTKITDNWLKPANADLKRAVGQEFNKFKTALETLIEQRRAAIESGAEAAADAKDRVDLSLPGVVRPLGSRHLIRQVMQEIEDIFFSIGFSVVEGPEIETPYYNFEALNIPEFHPVRDDMDTFYMDLPDRQAGLPKGAPGPLLLRTHTSPMQIRTMEKQKPPVRVIVPGKVYRRDNPDATHSFAFHQVEGLAVDTDITFCDFTGTIEYFVKQFFGANVKTRFRPSYFPFTEPSVEFDVSCVFCGGSGTTASGTCGKCKGAGWIELFGAGMVDPAVYGFVGYDAKKVSGFAFGIGIDRLAMLKYGIDDLQVFFQNDVRFLKQFP
jgi:phenylalanyl-tRNA synthetase alpha chain